jgi:multidrug efflux pump subunit AcrB
VREIQMGGSVEAPIALRVIGKDNAVLASLGGLVEDCFGKVPGVVDVQNSFGSASPELRVAIDRDRAASLGIAASDVSAAIRTAVSGRTVTKFRDASGDEFDVDVNLGRGSDGEFKLSDLERIRLPAGSGAMVPLSQVAEVGFARGSQRVFHIGTERCLLVTADAAPGYNVNAMTDAIVRDLSAVPFPEGYRFEVAGDSASSKESFGSLGALFLASILAMLVLLTWQYGNISQPLVIFSAVPLSLTGAAIGLLVSGNELSFTALLGLTSLAGIVVKNSIILIDFINERRREGLAIDRAIAEAGEVRMMPIFLTTGTMVMGLMPLVVSGSKLWGPMAWVQVCGLLFSTALTLVVVPVLYKILCKRMPERDTMSDARERADT